MRPGNPRTPRCRESGDFPGPKVPERPAEVRPHSSPYPRSDLLACREWARAGLGRPGARRVAPISRSDHRVVPRAGLGSGESGYPAVGGRHLTARVGAGDARPRYRPSASLPAALFWSLRHLTDSQRTLFGLLGIARGVDISLPAVVSLTAHPAALARRVLWGLRRHAWLNGNCTAGTRCMTWSASTPPPPFTGYLTTYGNRP
jgi:hypothetical protein